VFLFISTLTYIRVLWTVKRSPDVVPVLAEHPAANEEKEEKKSRRHRKIPRQDDIEARDGWRPPDLSADSPGLEMFYSKDVFVCEGDGRPKWCHECHQWKPDRAHHSSELGCCIYKMDHFCPWVGGMVSETCKSMAAPDRVLQHFSFSVS
jgi:palmitoyltransferase